ncbi:hypothetical protein FACS1894152_5490 [Bacilli bacterium]|nr:hypothetical protein FACS1894152_5490 [Bacilli bacterium]
MANTKRLICNDEELIKKVVASGKDYLPYEDFEVQLFKDNPEFAIERIEDELKEYIETGEPIFLKMQLRTAISAFGYGKLTEMTGISERIIANIVEGENKPYFTNVLEFTNALGYKFQLSRRLKLHKMA